MNRQEFNDKLEAFVVMGEELQQAVGTNRDRAYGLELELYHLHQQAERIKAELAPEPVQRLDHRRGC